METRQLRAEIERLGSGRKRKFGAELRARLIDAARQLSATGSSQTKIAKALGVSQVTVGRYLRGKSIGRSVRVSSRPVTVSAVPASKVTTPSGFEVDGLDVSEIVTLIRALS